MTVKRVAGPPFGRFEADYFKTTYRDYVAQNPQRKLRFYAAMVERHASARAPRRIHDIGCAEGRFLGCLDESWEICGTDVSEFALTRAARDHPRGRFKLAPVDGGPAFGEPFGVVTAFDVVEHVANLDAVATSVNQELAEDGAFVFVVPVYDGMAGPFVRWLDHDPTHVHKWPRGRWLEWAAAHFTVVEWRGIVRYLLPGGYYVHVVTQRWRQHTPAIIAVCRKH